MLAVVADSSDEASTLIISTGYALPTPPRHVAVTANAGLVDNQGTVRAPYTRGLLIEVSMVPGTGGVSAAAGRQAGATASTVALNTAFPTEIPAVNDRFCNQDDALFDQGYDSEGEQLYYDPVALDEDADDFVEEAIGSTPPQAIATALPPLPPLPSIVATTTASPVLDVKKLKVAELKVELRKRGRGVVGNKDVLIARLVAAIEANVPVASAAVAAAPREPGMGGLDVTARWLLLNHNPTPIAEPTNADGTLRPPTERDAPVNPKYRYDDQFVRDSFTGKTHKMKYMHESARKRRKPGQAPSRKETPVPRTKHRVRGGPNSSFLKKHDLDEHAHPMDWFNALMPMFPEDNLEDPLKANVKGDGVSKFSVSQWAAYSNTKATLANAGQKGHIFEGKFKPFTPHDIMKVIGVYVIDGLAPLPQLTLKMQPHSVQRTHGNDFIAKSIGSGYQQLQRSFRHFFGCQDPLTVPPPKEKCPNVKVDELFRWCRYIWKEAWELAENFSIDEQTCSMQGKSEYKTRCGKFKRIGDGIQTDCIADDGFTYDFYFRNEPVDTKWIDKGMCPMHARLLHMFGNLKEAGHRCKMDNLFNSVSLVRTGVVTWYCKRSWMGRGPTRLDER